MTSQPEASRRARVITGLGLVALVGLSAWRLLEPAKVPQTAVFTGMTMGTSFSVKLAEAPSDARAEAVTKAIAETLQQVDATASTYRSDSELSRFNQHSEVGQPFAISASLRTLFEVALEIGNRSGGALDVTVGPLVNAWGFGPGKRDVPDAAKLAELRTRVGLRQLRLDAAGLHKAHAQLTCDLSAIAKGYAVDRVAEALKDLGYTDFLVEIGGELKGRGHRRGDAPWRVGIEKPLLARQAPAQAPARAVQRVVPLVDMGMATSGDYRNYFQQHGVRRSHLIDPRTGRPIAHNLASVTVLDPSAARADGWATALSILGPEEGPAVARREGLAAFFVVRTGDPAFRSIGTPAFDRLVGAGKP